MSTINLHQSGQRAVTCISNTFIDHYMAKANGEYVKIYLYLLRKLSGSSCELSIADIADRFDHTEKDILRSLYYWEKMNLLSLEYFSNGELCGIRLHEPKKPAEAETSANHSHSSEKSSAKKSSTRKSSTSAFDIPALLEPDVEFEQEELPLQMPEPSASKPLMENKPASPASKPLMESKPASPSSKPLMESKPTSPASKPLMESEPAPPASKPVTKSEPTPPANKPVIEPVMIRKPTVEATVEPIATSTPVQKPQTPTKAVSKPTPAPVTPAVAPVASRPNYTLEEIQAFQQDETISEVIFITQMYIGHPLSNNDLNILLYWYDELKMSIDLIDFLVQHCITKGHSSLRYMDKIALSWHEQGITTVKQAKAESNMHSQIYNAILKAFGITGRTLAEAETVYVQKWTKTYGFDIELIREACNRTMVATHQPSFEYADGILSKWHKNQVHTLQDVKKLDDAFQKEKSSQKKTSTSSPKASTKNKFNNFEQRDYDYEELEKFLLNTDV